jgi:hypothetical protein
MYAVVNHLHFKRPVAELREAVQQSGGPLLARERGFRQLYLIQEGEDRGVIIILWDDAASAEDGARSFGPIWFAENIIPHLAGPQDRRSGEVLAAYPPAQEDSHESG